MSLPSAIFFINADINSDIQSTLVTQLFINEVMNDTEFDNRVLVEPNYASLVHLNGIRILVIRQDFRNYANRDLADVVIFLKNGLATILVNNLGPPGLALPIERLNMYALLRYNGSNQVVILPPEATPPPPFGLRGILSSQYTDPSGVHLPNEDNEYNNEDFLNRK